jgi:uncharacterized membrane protein YdjX (TVP38/TMEM64 family)
VNDWFTVENIEAIEAQYRTLGPLIGILFPFLEAFLPFLPLVVFVVANATSHGILLGFLYSWVGTVLGSFGVFLVVRKFGRHRKLQRFIQNDKVQKLIRWVDMRGLGPLFVLLCFPFTPSVLVNVVAGLSNIKKKYYLFVLMAGKFVMILTITLLGYDVSALLQQPVKLIGVIAVIVVLWLVGKAVEKRLNMRVEMDLKKIKEEKRKKLSVVYEDKKGSTNQT